MTITFEIIDADLSALVEFLAPKDGDGNIVTEDGEGNLLPVQTKKAVLLGVLDDHVSMLLTRAAKDKAARAVRNRKGVLA